MFKINYLTDSQQDDSRFSTEEIRFLDCFVKYPKRLETSTVTANIFAVLKPEARNIIYTVTSPLSAYFAGMHAVQYHKDENLIIIFEYGKRRLAVQQQMLDICQIFPWQQVLDLSVPVTGSYETRPGLRKRIVRKVKSWPVINPVYNTLLKKKIKDIRDENLARLNPLQINGNDTLLYLLHQTLMNEALITRFKNAKHSYFEHGLGDYVFWLQNNGMHPFYCFFNEALKTYVRKSLPEAEKNILPLALQSFPATTLPLHWYNATGKRNLAVWFLQPLDIYHVSEECWRDYTREVLKQCRESGAERMLIKPHPAQSVHSMQIVKDELAKHPVEVIIPDDENFDAAPAEFIFPAIEEETCLVISLFSSSLFYLASLYGHRGHTRFMYSYDFLQKYLRHAPAQFRDQYNKQEKLIHEVYARNCESF